MELLIQILHILTCLALIAIVLLQHGKGADIGVQFGGGGSNTVFGARGAGNFLTKLTTGAAIVFMITSFGLSRVVGSGQYDDLLEGPEPAAASSSPAETEPDVPESTFEAIPLPDEGGTGAGEATEAGDAPSGFEAIEPPASEPAPDAGDAAEETPDPTSGEQ